MAEYITKEQAINALLLKGQKSTRHKLGETWELNLFEIQEAINTIPVTDVQPVDTKEILRHLDSLMICVCNAYNTSHYLLESDMEFIEKQEKIIKGLLSNETIKGVKNNG